ncbi:MAG TPA: hypothetical protein VGN98_12190, partial [Tianweitania sediminis]|nr:hypothetical protein [Tianweitania sediminis]
MAFKLSPSRKPDRSIEEQDVSKELEDALAFDLNGDLDVAASMEDLEAQISQAAEELAREGRSNEESVTRAEAARREIAIDDVSRSAEDDTLDLDDAMFYSGPTGTPAQKTVQGPSEEAPGAQTPSEPVSFDDHLNAPEQAVPAAAAGSAAPAAANASADTAPTTQPRRAEPAPVAFAPANDDRFRTSRPPLALERRPSRAAYWGATVLST